MAKGTTCDHPYPRPPLLLVRVRALVPGVVLARAEGTDVGKFASHTDLANWPKILQPRRTRLKHSWDHRRSSLRLSGEKRGLEA